MTTSRWPAVVDALVTAATATGVDVRESVKVTEDYPSEYIVVGGTNEPGDDAGDFDQAWAGLGAKAKDERGTVVLCVVVQSGDTNTFPTLRARAFVIFGLLETAIRADPTLAAAVSGGWLNISAGRPRQVQNTGGEYVRIVVDVTYQARI